MRRTVICFIVMAFAFSSTFAIGKKYDSNTYEAVPVSINTKGYEFGLSNYRNNSVVFFQTDSTVSDLKDKKISNKGVVILSSKIDKLGVFSAPQVCQELMDLGVTGSFAYDSKKDKIYFSKYNDVKKVYQLYQSTYNEEKWDTPEIVEIKNLTPSRMNMSPIVNANWDYLDPGASIIHPTLANNGKRLYFVSNLKGGKGKTDVWYIDNEGDVWSEPVNLGAGVNSEMNEQYPFVIGDSVMYYASNVGGEGKYDLFVARIAQNMQDSLEVQNVGQLINSQTNQYNLIKNGNHILFVSERDTTKDDVFILNALPMPDEILFVEALPEAQPEMYTEPEFQHVLFFFDYDKSNMKKEYEDQLQQAVLEMKQFSDRKFEVVGHTDERGSVAYNDRLSKKRAKTIKNLLVERGVSKDVIVLKAYGKSMPVVKDAKTDDDHAKNRRVEINFYSEK